jgi:phytoene synthase
MLPARTREPAYGLYAFCRLSDDAIDLNGGSIDALERLRRRLANIYEGRPEAAAADRAMADLVGRFSIPRALPEALLEGLAWDAGGRSYESLDTLLDYAARVAGAVGVMMTLIMGVREPDVLARACDLGVAMQLTNIARDVGEDARAGRLYLPRAWLREAGLDPEEFLRRPAISAPLKSVIARTLEVAEAFYEQALPGIAGLPLACRPAVLSAAFLYAEIGSEIRRLALDSVARRARVSCARKVVLVGSALLSAPVVRRGPSVPPLGAVAFLVRAVPSAAPPAQPPPNRAAIWDIKAQLLSVLDMFERLERAQQLGR